MLRDAWGLAARAPLWARLLACAVCLLLGAVSFRQPLASVWPTSDFTYSKDFGQDYLLGRAVLAGDQLYVPLQRLAARYLALPNNPSAPELITPHPPTLGVFFAPLAMLEYPVAAMVW